MARLVAPAIVLAGLVLWFATGEWRWMVSGAGAAYLATVVIHRMPGIRRRAAASRHQSVREALPRATPAEDVSDVIALGLLPAGVVVWVWTGRWWAGVAVLVVAVAMLGVTGFRQAGRDLGSG